MVTPYLTPPPARAAVVAEAPVLAEIMGDLGLVAGATIQSVQRRLNVGTANAMRLLALREAISAALLASPPPDPDPPAPQETKS